MAAANASRARTRLYQHAGALHRAAWAQLLGTLSRTVTGLLKPEI